MRCQFQIWLWKGIRWSDGADGKRIGPGFKRETMFWFRMNGLEWVWGGGGTVVEQWEPYEFTCIIFDRWMNGMETVKRSMGDGEGVGDKITPHIQQKVRIIQQMCPRVGSGQR